MYALRVQSLIKATPEELKQGNIKENVAEIRVEKNRSGSTGICELLFKPECTKFINPPADYHNDSTAPYQAVRKNEIIQDETEETEEEFDYDSYNQEEIPPIDDDDIPPEDDGSIPF